MNPSLSNIKSTTPATVNNNAKLKTQADQMIIDTQRSFARILSQLMEDREPSDSSFSPIQTDVLNIPNLAPRDVIYSPISTKPSQYPTTRVYPTQASAQTSGLTSTSQLNQAARLNEILKGKLEGTGELFVSAGQRFGVNPALLASISMHETGNGSSRAAHERNNISGTMTSSGLKNYSTVEESIMDMARNIRKNYLDEGLTSIQQIGNKYAPIGAENDPTSLNQYWVSQVTKNFKSFTT
ncbi:MAG TPA: glucosaminidase domain-containing protein [Bacillota bacterium]|nr:glucosaminidase domain-containing protein [Bacillota bacterium]